MTRYLTNIVRSFGCCQIHGSLEEVVVGSLYEPRWLDGELREVVEEEEVAMRPGWEVERPCLGV